MQAVEDGTIKPIAEHLDAQQAAWLGAHMLTRGLEADPSLLVDFLAGNTEGGLQLPAQFYGCLQGHRQVNQSSHYNFSSLLLGVSKVLLDLVSPGIPVLGLPEPARSQS